jgi:hypothetical protein
MSRVILLTAHLEDNYRHSSHTRPSRLILSSPYATGACNNHRACALSAADVGGSRYGRFDLNQVSIPKRIAEFPRPDRVLGDHESLHNSNYGY